MAYFDLQPREWKLTAALASIIGLRMFGLFLVLPVLVLLSRDLDGYSPARAGLAIGAYGLSQALLQRPFGRLSDRFGRRRILLVGLGLFTMGSIMAALASDMLWLIGARFIQGCGAVAGVALAFAADHTRPERRSVAMAVIGMAIGASFLVAIALGAPLAATLGLDGLFALTAGLGLLAMLVALRTPREHGIADEVRQADETDSGIGLLGGSVFLLHAQLTAMFVALPVMFEQFYGIGVAAQWKVYVPALLLSAATVFPLLRRIGNADREQSALPISFAMLGGMLCVLGIGLAQAWLLWLMWLYFAAFNLLEAMMPTLVSQRGGARGRGARMGAYTTWQFLGAFAGGSLGGQLLARYDTTVTLWVLSGVTLGWSILLKWRSGRSSRHQ